MKYSVSAISLALSMSLILIRQGYADTFDYEVGVSYEVSNMSTSFEAGISPFPIVQPLRIEGETDTDDYGVFGTWYFNGVKAEKGPRSRAAFIGRASSVSLSYSHSSSDITTSTISVDPNFPSFTSRGELSGDNFSAGLRWVWSQSGWYGLANLSTVELDNDFGSLGSFEIGADAYGLGIGKYIGSRTTVDLTVLRVEPDSSGIFLIGGDSSSSTEAVVSFSHIGDLGATWQYGADIVVDSSSLGASDGSFDIRLSLYPSRPVAFGIDVNAALEDTSDERQTYEIFASWFPSENIELAARYGWVNFDLVNGGDFDEDSFGVGANIRF